MIRSSQALMAWCRYSGKGAVFRWDKNGEVNVRDFAWDCEPEALHLEDISAQAAAKRRFSGVLAASLTVAAIRGIFTRVMDWPISPLIATAVGQRQLAGAGVLSRTIVQMMGKGVERHQKYRNNE